MLTMVVGVIICSIILYMAIQEELYFLFLSKIRLLFLIAQQSTQMWRKAMNQVRVWLIIWRKSLLFSYKDDLRPYLNKNPEESKNPRDELMQVLQQLTILRGRNMKMDKLTEMPGDTKNNRLLQSNWKMVINFQRWKIGQTSYR